MSDDDLVILVVAYDDVDTARRDFNDLAAARRDHRVRHYDAALIETLANGRHDVVSTTVNPREKATLRCAGLGLVVGVLFTPALSAALVGGGFGAAVGHVIERADAFKHADLSEVERVVGDGAANLLVIAAPDVVEDIVEAAQSRQRRIRLPLEHADITLLKKELQDPGNPPTVQT